MPPAARTGRAGGTLFRTHAVVGLLIPAPPDHRGTPCEPESSPLSDGLVSGAGGQAGRYRATWPSAVETSWADSTTSADSSSSRSVLQRTDGTEMLMAATAAPVRSWTGAATQKTSSLDSQYSDAHPRERTSANCDLSRTSELMLEGVSMGSRPSAG